jgi:hypothetical protein
MQGLRTWQAAHFAARGKHNGLAHATLAAMRGVA